MASETVYADLHTHTHCSDGELAPEALVQRAAKRSVRVLAVTDHDTMEGVEAAQAAAQSHGLRLVTGVELSVTVDGTEIHLLAYGMDPGDEALTDHLRAMMEARRDRVRKIVERLASLGIELHDKKLAETVESDTAVGRPHVAEALVRGEYVETIEEAFEKFLGPDQAAFVAKPDVPAARAISLVHEGGGAAVLAHPGHWTSSGTIRRLVDVGLDGIETVHPSHDASLQAYYHRVARGYDLFETGGSDYHGWSTDEDDALGTVGMTKEAWERFREAAL